MKSNRVVESAGGRFGKRVVLPIAGLVAAASILVVSFVLMSAWRQDALAIESSNRLAQTALEVKKREIARNLKDYAVWEDAYKNLHVELNLAWAATDGNVGANIYNSLGYDMAFAVAPGNKTVYAVIDGEPQTADALRLVPGIERMLGKGSDGREARRWPASLGCGYPAGGRDSNPSSVGARFQAASGAALHPGLREETVGGFPREN